MGQQPFLKQGSEHAFGASAVQLQVSLLKYRRQLHCRDALTRLAGINCGWCAAVGLIIYVVEVCKADCTGSSTSTAAKIDVNSSEFKTFSLPSPGQDADRHVRPHEQTPVEQTARDEGRTRSRVNRLVQRTRRFRASQALLQALATSAVVVVLVVVVGGRSWGVGAVFPTTHLSDPHAQTEPHGKFGNAARRCSL